VVYSSLKDMMLKFGAARLRHPEEAEA